MLRLAFVTDIAIVIERCFEPNSELTLSVNYYVYYNN